MDVADSEQPPSTAQLSPRLPAWVIPVCLLLGAGLWAWLGVEGNWTVAQVVGVGAAALLVLLPQTRAPLAEGFARVNAMRPPALRLAAVAVFALSALYLVSTAIFQGRDLFPKWHDHQMLMLQARLLSVGRLWMPQHPCADFFETFYVFVKPLYAAMYFPGGALAFVPALWAGIASWAWSALIAGGVVAVLFRVVAEMVDPVAGFVAALLMVSLADFRRVAVWPASHHVFTLMALLAVWAWLRWRARPARPLAWAAVAGAALGWAAITRPVDALAYGLPLAVAAAWDLRTVGSRRRAATLLIAAAAAAPFLSLQLALDKKITGSFLHNPVTYYGHVEVPGLEAYGPGKDPASVRATSALPQKQAFAKEFVIPVHVEYVTEPRTATLKRRAGGLLEVGLPGALAMFVLPLGIVGCGWGKRWVLAATPLTFLTGYLGSPAFLSHYCVVAAPGLVLCLVAGPQVLMRSLPRTGQVLSIFLVLALAMLGVGQLPEVAGTQDDPVHWPLVQYNYEVLPKQVTPPAVVLYRYSPKSSFHEEPVYNIDAAGPDDCPIVRAHDLGPRDREIIEYYARVQPGRRFYRFDRADGSLTALGTAKELARQR